jgi:hypothetical protein
MQLWISASEARELGCTHRARFLGIVPGFFDPETALWVPRSDLLNPLEDLLSHIWAIMHQIRGEEPEFFFAVGRPL